MDKYLEFLDAKKLRIVESGFDVDENDLNINLFPFQRFCVKRALKHGKYAIFSGTGTGKSLMQLSFAEEVVRHTDKPVLILAPLAVSEQTIEQGEKFGIKVHHWNNHWKDRYEDCNSPMQRGNIFITNYEQLDNVPCDIFEGVVCDESGILKNYEGAIKEQVITNFKDTPYKLACSATPSPNDVMELGNHAEFFNVMSRNEMLAMYFVHDGGETSKWRLKGHAEQKFWDWVSTWAIMFTTPSDIGFPDDGYNLPPLNIKELEIKTPPRNNGKLFNDDAVSATTFNAELRLTKELRLNAIADLVNDSTENWIVWVKQNEESDYMKKLIPDAVEVRGSDTRDYKRDKLLGFARNEFRVLISKTKICGFGMNYQHCHNQAFPSPDFSFEGFYQAIRRSYRFGQKSEVNIFVTVTDTMQNVVQTVKTKAEQFEDMQTAMKKAMGRNLHIAKEKTVSMFEEIKESNFHLMRGDCVQLIRNIPDESIDLSVFSPPFASLYVYSDQLEDMGNSKDFNEFCIAFDFLVTELFRTTKTGRNVVVHCMDLPIQKGKEGFIGLRDFTGMIRESFENAGFVYHSRVTCWRNPVTEMQRTKALGLLHKQLKKDAAMSRVGLPDYLLAFRKDGDAVNPVHVNIPVDLWQKWASPVWMDIDFGNTLNGRQAREEKDERHIAPLSLDIIERVIALWSNEGDTVLSPFAGIGSEIYQAIKMNRNGIGMELKKSYYTKAKENCNSVNEEKKQVQLF